MKYRKKPVVIEAVQFNGFNKENGHVEMSERPEWLLNEFGRKILFFDNPNSLTIQTLEGRMIANIGDFIIKGVNDELYPCKPDIFEKTYDKVTDEILYGGFCGGGMSYHINMLKVHENTLRCPVCGKPLYIQETSGIAVCSDSNCEYGHA